MVSLEPQALLACLLLESTPTGRPFFFCLAADLSNFTGGTALLFWIREPYKPRNLKLNLRVCSSRARGCHRLALEAELVASDTGPRTSVPSRDL